MKKLNITFVGLTITSSWGNGHATTYRSLIKGLTAEGHQVRFLEKNTSWYEAHRDFTEVPYCSIGMYEDLPHLLRNYGDWLEDADVVVIGSYVTDTFPLVEWLISHSNTLLAYYDIDTPVTIEKLEQHDYEYLTPSIIPAFDLYLSFSGGPILDYIATQYGAHCVRPLYCSVDTSVYYPNETPDGSLSKIPGIDLGYLGTYSPDRQGTLEKILMAAAESWPDGRFVVAGAMYPPEISWPENVLHIEHLPPSEHRAFYTNQRFTLNVTRQAMIGFGYSPSVRLFEAAACGVPVISDYWAGIEDFFKPGEEILIADSVEVALHYLRDMEEDSRRLIAQKARARVLESHSSAVRAREFLDYVGECRTEILKENTAQYQGI